MSQYIEGPRKTFKAGSTAGAHLRWKISDATTVPVTVALCGASDPSIGMNEEPVLVSGDDVTLRLTNAQGTRKMVAAGAITGGNPVYAAASGKIDGSGTVIEGRALQTAATSDVIEVLPIPNSDIATSISGTTAAAFTVDSDSSTPKIKLSGVAAGTGNFTTTIKPETALAADNAIIVPEADGDTLVAVALAQTLTNKTLTSPVLTTPQINDTTADHQYVVAVNELIADRTVTLPLLTGADEFVFKDHAVTLTNKTLTSPVLNALPKFENTVTPVAAAGTTVADAGQLASTMVNHITSDLGTKGVKFATGSQNHLAIVINNSATAAELYAATGGTVNGLGVDASVVIPASKGVLAFCTAADTWIVFDLPAKATAS